MMWVRDIFTAVQSPKAERMCMSLPFMNSSEDSFFEQSA